MKLNQDEPFLALMVVATQSLPDSLPKPLREIKAFTQPELTNAMYPIKRQRQVKVQSYNRPNLHR